MRQDVAATASLILFFVVLYLANPTMSPTIAIVAAIGLGNIIAATGIREGWWR